MTTKATTTSHITLMQRPFGAPRFHFEENNSGGGGGGDGGGGNNNQQQQTAWHTGLDAEIIGHAQNKGWKLDDPKEAFAGAVKQARELERHFGVPADQLLKMPKADAKPEEISAFRQRLGMPADAKDYDFSTIKDAAGQPLAQPLADTLRATLHAVGTPKDAAAAIAASVQKHIDSVQTQQTTVDSGKLAEQKEALKANWGANFEYNKLKAADGARRLGMDAEAVTALESVIGYDKVMEALRKIGVGTSEATFVERGTGSNGQVTTREGAVARKAELMADKPWADRYLKGGATERREMDTLNKLIVGDAA